MVYRFSASQIESYSKHQSNPSLGQFVQLNRDIQERSRFK